MKRRSFLKSAGLGGAALAAPAAVPAAPSLPPMKIKRVRFYWNPASRPMINQSFHIVTVETDAGITGIGEGGTAELIKLLAPLLIGEDPSRISHLWQLMFRGYFYPPGRELVHALGALDMALWDIKGKALGVPVWELLGGQARDHIECYATAFPDKGTLEETAKACIEEGFRAFRWHGIDPEPGKPYNSHVAVTKTYENCVRIREAIGPAADWAIDFHTRFDFPDAVRLCTLIEPLAPYFVEDLIRSENPGVYRQLRPQVKVPIAVGEHFGPRWDGNNELIENRLIDYARVSIPNCGGITEYVKIAAMCETHYVGLVPHFTGPLAEAALVHACTVFPGPVLMEMVGDSKPKPIPHLPECYDFKDGKMWPNRRPGLGATLDPKPLTLAAEVTEHAQPIPLLRRPDGSITNW
jgi:L-alanine-DL-glutamate epimerase-like enolase superfamily enzyme